MLRSILVVLCAMVSTTVRSQAGDFVFDFPPPAAVADLRDVRIWSTQYLVHPALARPAGGDAIELRGRHSGGLGIRVGRRDFCNAAMEGTVSVSVAGSIRTFNVDGLQGGSQADCAPYFRTMSPGVLGKLGRQTFTEVSGARIYGLGIRGYRLVPYRTIAADPTFIKPGTVLYIAGLRGKMVHLPDGAFARHDGYVFVGDRGGAIRGNHVDFFTGLDAANPAPSIITSDRRRPFEAVVVTDRAIISRLREAHLER